MFRMQQKTTTKKCRRKDSKWMAYVLWINNDLDYSESIEGVTMKSKQLKEPPTVKSEAIYLPTKIHSILPSHFIHLKQIRLQPLISYRISDILIIQVSVLFSSFIGVYFDL